MTEPMPPSPDDDRARNDAIREIARVAVIWAVPLAVIGAIAIALGVPWWIVAIAITGVVLYLLVEA